MALYCSSVGVASARVSGVQHSSVIRVCFLVSVTLVQAWKTMRKVAAVSVGAVSISEEEIETRLCFVVRWQRAWPKFVRAMGKYAFVGVRADAIHPPATNFSLVHLTAARGEWHL